VEEVLAEIAISAPSLADMATVSDLAAEAARALPVPMNANLPLFGHLDTIIKTRRARRTSKPRPAADTDLTQLDLFNLAAATAQSSTTQQALF
jgi:hypothetical protein